MISQNLFFTLKLVGLGADVNGWDRSYIPPVTRAVHENHVDMIRALFALGADLNITIKNGTSSVYVAAVEGLAASLRHWVMWELI